LPQTNATRKVMKYVTRARVTNYVTSIITLTRFWPIYCRYS